MFSIFSKSDAPKPAVKAEPSPALHSARAETSAAANQQDIKTAYLSHNDLASGKLKEILAVAGGPALVMGFISPDLSMPEVSSSIKRELPSDAKLILMTTAGELCRPAGSQSLYCSAEENRGKVLLQVYSKHMIENTYIMSIPLPNEDLRSGQVRMTVNERVELIQKEIERHQIPFRISTNHTFALVYVDGLSNCETFVLQALYASRKCPCPYIGGSAGGKLDFVNTYIYDNEKVTENHAVITLVRLTKPYRYGIFKTQAVERTGDVYSVVGANTSLRYIDSRFP